jgi:hypothetical protein
LGALAFAGGVLPDATLRGMRMSRSHGGTVLTVAGRDLSSEASKPAWTDGCATGLRTWARHVCDFVSASRPVCTGTATASDSALAPCNGSDLLTLRLLFAHKPAVPFLGSPTFREFFTGPAETSCSPRDRRSLCPAFRRLWFLRTGFRPPARAACPVLMHSSNRTPSG